MAITLPPVFVCYAQVSNMRPFQHLTVGSRDGAVVRAFTSHQCDPVLIPGLGVICGVSMLLILLLVLRGFSPGALVFPSPRKPTFPNANLIWRVHPISVLCLHCHFKNDKSDRSVKVMLFLLLMDTYNISV